MGIFRKNVSGFLAVAVMAVLASACARQMPYDVDRDVTFTANAADAIVVIGMKSVAPTPGLFEDTVRLTWGKLKQGDPQPDVPGFFSITNAKRFMGVGTGTSSDVKWHLVRVPPGSYGLYEVSAQSGNHTRITRFSNGISVPFFTVKPGEVRYIGDLHWDIKSYPAKFVMLTRNDGAAKQILAEHPGIIVKPHFRPPAIVAKAGEPAQFLVVAE
jgi:hypothetical protein